MPTLLETAKNFKIEKKGIEATYEEIELALAWANDEIQAKQVAKALKRDPSAIYTVLARGLKQFLKNSQKN